MLYTFTTMKRGFRRTKVMKLPMYSKEGENDDVIRKRREEDHTFRSERNIEFHDFFKEEGYVNPLIYQEIELHGFLWNEEDNGFGGGFAPWPFSFVLAVKDEKYRSGVLQAINNRRYAANWRLKASDLMSTVVKSVQTAHTVHVEAFNERAADEPSLPQDDYDEFAELALRKYEIMEELRLIVKLAASEGWYETARMVGYNSFLGRYQTDPLYAQFKDVSDAVNTIKKEMETAILNKHAE